MRVPDTIWTTDATLLWFVAVDPDGQHETGEPVCWTNTLTLTHQPRGLHNAHRQVELTVKPRGTIRWNTTGANPRDGEVYTGPIMLNGGGEITIYAYAGSPYEDWVALAWTGALLITAGVLLLNVVARVVLRKS